MGWPYKIFEEHQYVTISQMEHRQRCCSFATAISCAQLCAICARACDRIASGKSGRAFLFWHAPRANLKVQKTHLLLANLSAMREQLDSRGCSKETCGKYVSLTPYAKLNVKAVFAALMRSRAIASGCWLDQHATFL